MSDRAFQFGDLVKLTAPVAAQLGDVVDAGELAIVVRPLAGEYEVMTLAGPAQADAAALELAEQGRDWLRRAGFGPEHLRREEARR